VREHVAHPHAARDVVRLQRVGGDDSSYAAHGGRLSKQSATTRGTHVSQRVSFRG
jgi:hypothetical protein